jgi:hypothetical protein
MFRNKRESGAPAKTDLMSKVKRCSGPKDNRRPSEDRPDEQGEGVVQQPEGMTKTTPKAKKSGRRK